MWLNLEYRVCSLARGRILNTSNKGVIETLNPSTILQRFPLRLRLVNDQKNLHTKLI